MSAITTDAQVRELPATETAQDAVDPIEIDISQGQGTDLVEQELLVEDVSIDGMCGVY
jgi:mycofactocin precursor